MLLPFEQKKRCVQQSASESLTKCLSGVNSTGGSTAQAVLILLKSLKVGLE